MAFPEAVDLFFYGLASEKNRVEDIFYDSKEWP